MYDLFGFISCIIVNRNVFYSNDNVASYFRKAQHTIEWKLSLLGIPLTEQWSPVKLNLCGLKLLCTFSILTEDSKAEKETLKLQKSSMFLANKLATTDHFQTSFVHGFGLL